MGVIKVLGHPSPTPSVSAQGGGLIDLAPTPPEAVPPGNPVSDHLASRVLLAAPSIPNPPSPASCAWEFVCEDQLWRQREVLPSFGSKPESEAFQVAGARERGEKGPLQAGTARRHIWNCELGPSSGPWGQGGAAVGQPEGGEDPQRDPGARSPRIGEGLEPAARRLGLGAPVG